MSGLRLSNARKERMQQSGWVSVCMLPCAVLRRWGGKCKRRGAKRKQEQEGIKPSVVETGRSQ
jgi:hypothetical protein